MRKLTTILFYLAIMIGNPVAQSPRRTPPPAKPQNDVQPTQKSPKTIYDENREAVVVVKGKQKEGSGFVLTADGKIVTNYHVIFGKLAGNAVGYHRHGQD